MRVITYVNMLRQLLRRAQAEPSGTRVRTAVSLLGEELEVLASSSVIRDLGYARAGDRSPNT